LFILPSFIGCAIFVLIPFVDVIPRSFTLGLVGEFVWFYNYIDIFKNSAFQLAVGNTLRFVGICVPLLLVISLVLALALNQKVMGRGTLRAAFLVPLAIPVASVALLWQIMFHQNGLLGNFMELIGRERIDWMRTDWALMCLVISYIWKNAGYNIVLFLAGLSNISIAQYEAARIDGAGAFRIFRSVTLPGLMPTFFTVTVLSLLNTFKVFREAYLVAGDYPTQNIYLLQHMLNNWFTQLQLERLCAAATVIAIVIVVLVALLRRSWRTDNDES
jgi:multiple sugar transport system permease protein